MTWCWGRRRGLLRCDCDAWGFVFFPLQLLQLLLNRTDSRPLQRNVPLSSTVDPAEVEPHDVVTGLFLVNYERCYRTQIFFSFSSSNSNDNPAMLKTEKENPNSSPADCRSAADTETSVQYSPAGVPSGSQREEREFPMFSLLWQARRPTQKELMCSVWLPSSLNWRKKKKVKPLWVCDDEGIQASN